MGVSSPPPPRVVEVIFCCPVHPTGFFFHNPRFIQQGMMSIFFRHVSLFPNDLISPPSVSPPRLCVFLAGGFHKVVFHATTFFSFFRVRPPLRFWFYGLPPFRDWSFALLEGPSSKVSALILFFFLLWAFPFSHNFLPLLLFQVPFFFILLPLFGTV